MARIVLGTVTRTDAMAGKLVSSAQTSRVAEIRQLAVDSEPHVDGNTASVAYSVVANAAELDAGDADGAELSITEPAPEAARPLQPLPSSMPANLDQYFISGAQESAHDLDCFATEVPPEENAAEKQKSHLEVFSQNGGESAVISDVAASDKANPTASDDDVVPSIPSGVGSDTDLKIHAKVQISQGNALVDLPSASENTETDDSPAVKDYSIVTSPSSFNNAGLERCVSASGRPRDRTKQETQDDVIRLSEELPDVVNDIHQGEPALNIADAEPTHLVDYDTAILKDFLSRAEARKASRAATIAKRTSLSHRRDSGVVRQALASPRKLFEDEYPNSPSPQRMETSDNEDSARETADQLKIAPETAVTSPIPSSDDALTTTTATRRSSRSRSRIPTIPSHMPTASTVTAIAPAPNKIPVRRVDGADPVVLKKTEAQELATTTRTNTRKNKLGGISVKSRLLKLSDELSAVIAGAPSDADVLERVLANGQKGVRWAEQLTHYQDQVYEPSSSVDELQDEQTSANVIAPMAPAALNSDLPETAKPKKPHTPRIRRPRILNGTPAKSLLAPAPTQDVPALASPPKKRAVKALALPAPALAPSDVVLGLSSPAKKRHFVDKLTASASIATPDKDVPALASPAKKRLSKMDVEAGRKAEAVKERKSRLATPKKIRLPASTATAGGGVAEGKENRLVTPKKIGALGVSGAGAVRKRATRRM